jgi:fructuronate reductase
VREIFGDDLPKDPRFTDAVIENLARLYGQGAKRTVAEVKAD